MAATSGGMDGLTPVLGIVANVLSTTGVIISNKALLTRQRFPFIITGLMMNFCTTFTLLEVSARSGGFTPKSMPRNDRWLLALTAVSTVLFNNASVEANSVGTYQMAKLLIVPCIIILERIQGLQRVYTPAMYVTLSLIAFGVGLSTISDVELTTRGCAVGFLSTLLTARYQIWQGSKQHEHALNSKQISHTVMIPQICISLPAALLLDVAMPWVKALMFLPSVGMLETNPTDGSMLIFSGPGGTTELVANMILNNLLAVGINLTTYYIIGATSPVTYQVVGQLKTVLVIISGYFLFDVPPPPGMFAVRCTGMVLAISGVFTYGLLKAQLAAAQKKEAKSS